MSACVECFANDGHHKFSCSRRTAAAVDWRSARSSGYAAVVVHGGGSMESARFDAPIISHIKDNLWMGGCQDGLKLDDDFLTVVSLYPWEQYEISPSAARVEIRMLDSHEGIDIDDLDRAAGAVLEGLERGKTLVHCQAGLNRSGLVSAYALMKLGMSARDAIDLLREQRSPLVLCNQTFVRQLHELQHEMEALNEA